MLPLRVTANKYRTVAFSVVSQLPSPSNQATLLNFTGLQYHLHGCCDLCPGHNTAEVPIHVVLKNHDTCCVGHEPCFVSLAEWAAGA